MIPALLGIIAAFMGWMTWKDDIPKPKPVDLAKQEAKYEKKVAKAEEKQKYERRVLERTPSGYMTIAEYIEISE
ncbi:MAG: hypothetical protein LBJ74_05785, partial [Heliobacteriaceae bacterium]|nr:hypothetical protein [Heliobacteriaceae bacterium]